MKTLRTVALLALASVGLTLTAPATAFANDFADGVDADGNGTLSVEEFVMALGVREFSRRDTNQDNIMSADEWLGQGGDFQQLTYDRFNTDGDEVMSASELVEVFSWIFGNRDTNNDGALTPSEAPPFLRAT